MENIGERIIKARCRLNMNQKELSKKLEVSLSTLSRVENNLREPKASLLIQLSKVLNVSFDYLMGNSVYMEKCSIEYVKEFEITEILSLTRTYLTNKKIVHNGKPISKEDLNRLIDSIDFCLFKMEKMNM